MATAVADVWHVQDGGPAPRGARAWPLAIPMPCIPCSTHKAVPQSAPLPHAHYLVSLPLALLLRQQKTALVICLLLSLYGV
jgi:hypothetical protein